MREKSDLATVGAAHDLRGDVACLGSTRATIGGMVETMTPPLGTAQAPRCLVERTGLEPATDCLQSSCTTIVLPPHVPAGCSPTDFGPTRATRVRVVAGFMCPARPATTVAGSLARSTYVRHVAADVRRARESNPHADAKPAVCIRGRCRRQSAGPSMARQVRHGPWEGPSGRPSLRRGHRARSVTLTASYPSPESNREIPDLSRTPLPVGPEGQGHGRPDPPPRSRAAVPRRAVSPSLRRRRTGNRRR